MVVSGGSNGAGGTPGEGYEGTVSSYLQQHQAQLTLQQQSQLQQLQQLHHYQQQLLQYQQQQVSSTATVDIYVLVLMAQTVNRELTTSGLSATFASAVCYRIYRII